MFLKGGMSEMKEEIRSIGILGNRKAVILNDPFANANLFGWWKGALLIDSTGRFWPEYTGLAGQVFTYRFSDNGIIYAEELCCEDGLMELVRDTGCRIEDFIGADGELIRQEWKFAKIVDRF